MKATSRAAVKTQEWEVILVLREIGHFWRPCQVNGAVETGQTVLVVALLVRKENVPRIMWRLAVEFSMH